MKEAEKLQTSDIINYSFDLEVYTLCRTSLQLIA